MHEIKIPIAGRPGSSSPPRILAAPLRSPRWSRQRDEIVPRSVTCAPAILRMRSLPRGSRRLASPSVVGCSPNMVRYIHKLPERRQKAGCWTSSFSFHAHPSASHSDGSEVSSGLHKGHEVRGFSRCSCRWPKSATRVSRASNSLSQPNSSPFTRRSPSVARPAGISTKCDFARGVFQMVSWVLGIFFSAGSCCSMYARVSACINRCSTATSSMAASCGWPSDGRRNARNNGLIQLALQLLIVAVDFTALWPIRRLIRRQAANPPGRFRMQKLIKSRMKRLQP